MTRRECVAIDVLDALRDAQARVVRIVEALEDGEHGFARELADALAHDLWGLIESSSKAAR